MWSGVKDEVDRPNEQVTWWTTLPTASSYLGAIDASGSLTGIRLRHSPRTNIGSQHASTVVMPDNIPICSTYQQFTHYCFIVTTYRVPHNLADAYRQQTKYTELYSGNLWSTQKIFLPCVIRLHNVFSQCYNIVWASLCPSPLWVPQGSKHNIKNMQNIQ